MEIGDRRRSIQCRSFLFSISVIYVFILTVILLLCTGQSSGSHLSQGRRRSGAGGAQDTRNRPLRPRNVFQPARFRGGTSTSTRGSRPLPQDCSTGRPCERTQSRTGPRPSSQGQRGRLSTSNNRRSRTRPSSRNVTRQPTRGSSRPRSNRRSRTRSSASPSGRRRPNFRAMTNDQASRRMRNRGRSSPVKSGSNNMRNDINRFLNGIRSSLPSNLGIGLGISLPSDTGKSSSSQGQLADTRSDMRDSNRFDSSRTDGSRTSGRLRDSQRFSGRSRNSGRSVQLQQPVLITDNEAPGMNPADDRTIVFQDPITGTSVMEVSTPPPSNTFLNSWAPDSGPKDAATALFADPPQNTFLASQSTGQRSLALQSPDLPSQSQNTPNTQDFSQETSGQMFISNPSNQPLSGQGFNSNQQGNVASNVNFMSSDMTSNQGLFTTNQNFDFGTQNVPNDNAGNTVGQPQLSVMNSQNMNQGMSPTASSTMQIQGQLSGINLQNNVANGNQQMNRGQAFSNNNQIQGQVQMQVDGANLDNTDTFMQPQSRGVNNQGQINSQAQVNNMQFLGQSTGNIGQSANTMGQNQNNFINNQGQIQEQMQGQIQPVQSNTLLSSQGQIQGQLQGQVQPMQGNTLLSNQGQFQGQLQGQNLQGNTLINNQGQVQGQLQGLVQPVQSNTFLNNQGQFQGQQQGQIQPLHGIALPSNQGQIQGQLQGQVQQMQGNTFLNNQGQLQGQLLGQVQNLQGNTLLSNQGQIQGQFQGQNQLLQGNPLLSSQGQIQGQAQGQIQSFQGSTMLQNNMQIQGQVMNNQNQMPANNLGMNQQLPSFNQGGAQGQNSNAGMLSQGILGQNQGMVSMFSGTNMNQEGGLIGQIQNNMQSNMNFDGNVNTLMNTGGTGRFQQNNDLGLANNIQNQNNAMTLSEQVQQLQNQLNQLQMAASSSNLQVGLPSFSNTEGNMQSLQTQMQNSDGGNMVRNQAQINPQATNAQSQLVKQETNVVNNNNIINSGSSNPSSISPTQSSMLNPGSQNSGGWFPIDVNGNQSPSKPIGTVNSLKPTMIQQSDISVPRQNLSANGLTTTVSPPVNATPKTLMIQIDPKSRGVKIVPDGKGGVKVISLRSAVTISPFGQEKSNYNGMSFLMKNPANMTLNMSDIQSETALGFSHNNVNSLTLTTVAPLAEQQVQNKALFGLGTTPSFETLNGLGPNDRINTTDVPEEYEFPNGSSPDVWPSNANKPKPKPDRHSATQNPNSGSGEVTAAPPTTDMNEEAGSVGEEEYEAMNAIDIAALDAYLFSGIESSEGSYNQETNQLIEQLTRIYEGSSSEIGSVADIVRGIMKQQSDGNHDNEQRSEGGPAKSNENGNQPMANLDATALDFNELIKKLNEVLRTVKRDRSMGQESTTPATNVEPVMKFYTLSHETNEARVLKTYHNSDYSHMSTIEIIDAIAKLVNLTSASHDSHLNRNGEVGQHELVNDPGQNAASVSTGHNGNGFSRKDHNFHGLNHHSEINNANNLVDRVSLGLSVGNIKTNNNTDLEAEVTVTESPVYLSTTESFALDLGFNALETTTAKHELASTATDPSGYSMHFGGHQISQNSHPVVAAGHRNTGKHPEHNILNLLHRTIHANPGIMFKDITRSKRTILSNDMPPT